MKKIERNIMDLFAGIQKLIVMELNVDKEDVVTEAHLQDDLGADSLALMNLSEAIATKFDIELTGDDLVDIENVGELIELVESRL